MCAFLNTLYYIYAYYIQYYDHQCSDHIQVRQQTKVWRKTHLFLSHPCIPEQQRFIIFICFYSLKKINAILEKNKPLWTVESLQQRTSVLQPARKTPPLPPPGWGLAPPTRRHRFFRVHLKRPESFLMCCSNCLARIKRTKKLLTRVFKNTDYASEVLERQEKLTFRMMFRHGENTTQTNSRGRRYSKNVKRRTDYITINKDNNGQTVHLTKQWEL